MAEKAVSDVNDIIADAIIGLNALDQAAVDKKMNTIDDTPNKLKLSASVILGVSSATAKAAAKALGLPLYQYLGGFNAKLLPIPLSFPTRAASGGLFVMSLFRAAYMCLPSRPFSNLPPSINNTTYTIIISHKKYFCKRYVK